MRGIRMTEEDAEKVREAAEATDVEIHVKAPYYINLAGDERNVEMSFHKIIAAGKLADIMGAETVVFHPGFYGDLSKEETMKRVVANLREIRNVFVREGWKPRLGIEVMGKRNVFGSLEEVIEVCQRVKGVIPVIDFGHIHARSNGMLQDPEDFQGVFDKLAPLGLKHYLIHFTGIHYENGNARYRLPIKKGDLKFEPLCEVLLENNYNATIVSTSPILEHDAMYMNIVFDRVKDRREQRIARELREEKEAEEKAKREEEKRRQAEEEKARKEAEAKKKAEEEAKRKAEEEAKKPVVCHALTKEGTQCRNIARKGTKYCSSHKGWRGKTIADLPENQTPKVQQSTPKKRRQVTVKDVSGESEYRLYQKDGRYYFMKAKKEGFSMIFKVPDGKEVRYNKNGVPILRSKEE